MRTCLWLPRSRGLLSSTWLEDVPEPRLPSGVSASEGLHASEGHEHSREAEMSSANSSWNCSRELIRGAEGREGVEGGVEGVEGGTWREGERERGRREAERREGAAGSAGGREGERREGGREGVERPREGGGREDAACLGLAIARGLLSPTSLEVCLATWPHDHRGATRSSRTTTAELHCTVHAQSQPRGCLLGGASLEVPALPRSRLA